jgi:DNA-binding PadR family transcriptional regulator
LHNNKLVSIKVVNRKKVYSLTAQGVKVLNEAVDANQDTIKMMLKEFKVMESICSPQERSHNESIIKDIKQNSLPFSNITEEISEIQKVLFKLHASGKIKSKEKEIKSIFNEAIVKLKKI